MSATAAVRRQPPFQRKSLELIAAVNAVVEEYRGLGLRLTLRQIYYRLLPHWWPRANKHARDRAYANLGRLVRRGREEGVIARDAIVDRTRYLRQLVTRDSPAEMIGDAASSYLRDVWAEQSTYVECWIEKDALVEVIGEACDQHRAAYMSARGDGSCTALLEAADRFSERLASTKARRGLVLHLSDHDYKGLAMTESVRARLNDPRYGSAAVEVRRVALTLAQVKAHHLPGVEVASGDGGHGADTLKRNYVRDHGPLYWELDALDPKTLSGLVTNELRAVIDQRRFRAVLQRERRERAVLEAIRDRWDEVEAFIKRT